jgi:DNA repair and recombination protein RAD52
MKFAPDQIALLKAPLDRSHVKQRAQAGRQLSYIEGWHAIAEANRIFGFAEWARELRDIRQLGEPREVDGKWRVAYMATVRITVAVEGGAVVRDGTGYGSGIDRDLGSAHESALKEAETDAMKRALMTFGNPFGLALYDKEQREVANTPAKPAAPAAPAAPAVDRVLTMIGRASDAIELGEWMASGKVLDAMAGMSEDDLERIAEAQKQKLASFERQAA